MPKNRKRTIVPGAKSVGIRTKFKLGNRKSSIGAKQLSTTELSATLNKVAKKDRNMLIRILESRELLPS